MSKDGTVVGAQTRIKGTLEGDEDLTVVGRVDGNISLTQTLTVEASGIVVADVQVQQAIISGTVVGNITATDLVHITAQGRVVGDLTAPRVVLVDGAAFKGNIDMGDLSAAFVEGQRPAARSTGSRKGAETAAEARPAREAPRSVAAPAPRPAPRPAPKPAPPPRRVAVPPPRRPSGAPTGPTAPSRLAEEPRAPEPPSSEEEKKAPKLPTTAGKKLKARRK